MPLRKLRLLVLDRPLNTLTNFYEQTVRRCQNEIQIEQVFGQSVPNGRSLLLGQPWHVIVLRQDFFSQTKRQLERLQQRQQKLNQQLPLVLIVANAAIELKDSLPEIAATYSCCAFVLRKNLGKSILHSLNWAMQYREPVVVNTEPNREEAV